MVSCTLLQTFWVTLPVTFVIGLGIALSLLNDHTSSLVGIAILESLVPPAVNAGVLWLYWTYIESASGYLPHPDPIATVDHLWDKGLLSLFLTLASILLIWVTSMLMFHMKQVSQSRFFWWILLWLKRYHK